MLHQDNTDWLHLAHSWTHLSMRGRMRLVKRRHGRVMWAGHWRRHHLVHRVATRAQGRAWVLRWRLPPMQPNQLTPVVRWSADRDTVG